MLFFYFIKKKNSRSGLRAACNDGQRAARDATRDTSRPSGAFLGPGIAGEP